MAILARAHRTITDLYDPVQQTTAPAAPVAGMLWLDTGVSPNQLKKYNGSGWDAVGLTPEDLDRAIRNAAPLINGTQASSTSAWTGNAPFSSLADGQQIAFKLPYASTSTAVTLNLSLAGGGATGAISCYYGGTTRLTTHYAQGGVITRSTTHRIFCIALPPLHYGQYSANDGEGQQNMRKTPPAEWALLDPLKGDESAISLGSMPKYMADSTTDFCVSLSSR